ncbi:leucine-rich repeats and immunoglobulin-like domains protein 1 isoform X2 [Perca fluviatilis]|uniref:leucine-rich repeats and immunoglobulin-like domains protein 1 isoform X2 n=1 Tax=Perca fluviatilis TaxID=8168 RepID=UPI001966C8F2|nr:leucine-rich repeats and immunoglobulin-like domains protein 1 isoform X2 [Perca fluviatilis]
MRLNNCLTILHVSILAALFLTLDADSTDSTCDIEIRVRRGTVYEAVLGEDLRIICSVAFCNNSPLTVSWYKYETTKPVPVDVSSSSHIKTEWTHLKPLEGISYLIFQKILRNDSGQYQCHTGGSMSHSINVSVYGTDSTCDIEIRVRRGTVYKALLGEDLRINCPVAFCNNSPLTVSWYKFETTKPVPVDVSSSSHIKTEWTHLKPLEGISYLIFQKILRNDSGQYQCHTGGSMSHSINVSVYGEVKLTTVTWTTLEPESTEETFWPNVYRVVGIMAFVITVLTVWVASSCGCKGESRDTPDLSCQPSHDALTTTTIYENV